MVTRSLDVDAEISRVRIMREIRDALCEEASVETYRMRTLLEVARKRDWLRALLYSLWKLCLGRAPSLQCMLYSAKSEVERLADAIVGGEFDAIYLDSVRSVALLRELNERVPHHRITVDFDDLLSRRMELLAINRWPIQLGHVQNWFPVALRRRIEGRWSRIIAHFESIALRRVEREVCKLAHAAVLVSPAEAALLEERLPGAHARIHGIPPAYRVSNRPIEIKGPLRFVFIGSDTNGQNRQSIDYLLHLWRRIQPSTGLHIYGRQCRSYADITNVYWHGYVQTLEAVYTDDSILALPVLRPGGIKTKLLEAWAYGRPALINELAMEGLELSDYPLIVRNDDWGSYVEDPTAHTMLWGRAAEIGRYFVEQQLSCEKFSAQWKSVVFGASDG